MELAEGLESRVSHSILYFICTSIPPSGTELQLHMITVALGYGAAEVRREG